jgi:hypothetical protein
MNERLWLFNPFDIQNWTDEQVAEQFRTFEKSIPDDDGTAFTYANTVEIYANMNALIGEMVARYAFRTAEREASLKSTMALYTYKQRDLWVQTNAEKAPAMSYFEAQSYAFYQTELLALAQMESNLKRFKYAYESFEAKQNAVKKKLESIRYDTFGR